MKIILIGGTGTIGQAIKKELSSTHEIVSIGRSTSISCNINSEKSIEEMFKKIGPFDAMIVAAGEVHFAPLEEMDGTKFQVGLNSKLMGQVNTVLIGMKYIKDNGSFTLTSGTLSLDPVRGGSSASLVNAALNGFVLGSSIELPRGIRINAVSPTIVTESLESYGSYFKGYESVSAHKVALAYVKSIEGHQTGKIYNVLP